jgi:hypothetical protein
VSLRTLLHVIVNVFLNKLLNVLVQIENWMKLPKTREVIWLCA